MRIQEIGLKNEKGASATAYLAENYFLGEKKKKRPAIIICPGGGFFSLSEREGEPVALRFTTEGFQSFVLHYQVIEREKMFVKSGGVLLDAMDAVAELVCHIKDHQEEYEIDANRILLLGFSAGGTIAAMYGNRYKEKRFEKICDGDYSKLEIAAVALGYPACDLQVVTDYMNSKKCSNENQEILARCIRAMIGKRTASEEEIRANSPLSYVTEHATHTFLWHTSDDALIPTEGSLRYVARLAQLGVPYEVHIYEGGVHGLSLGREHTAAILAEVNDYCSRWVDDLLRWFFYRV